MRQHAVCTWLCILLHALVLLHGLVSVSYSTFLKDCPFMIKVRMSPDGNKLVIKEMGGEHNHNLSKVSISIN